jgi:hypothetical protein
MLLLKSPIENEKKSNDKIKKKDIKKSNEKN